jgi:hypothetical protein
MSACLTGHHPYTCSTCLTHCVPACGANAFYHHLNRAQTSACPMHYKLGFCEVQVVFCCQKMYLYSIVMFLFVLRGVQIVLSALAFLKDAVCAYCCLAPRMYACWTHENYHAHTHVRTLS